MTIRIILIVAILLILAWFLQNRKTSKIKAGKKVAVIMFFLFAMASVIDPNLTDVVAHKVGVGRGADLLLYLLTVAFVAFALNQYMRGKEDEQKIVLLARKIAILEANQEPKNIHKNKN